MNIKDERGYTLVTVLLVVLLLTILGGAYIFAMNYEVRQSAQHDYRVQSYYLARSGAEIGYQRIGEGINAWLDPDKNHEDYFADFYANKDSGFTGLQDSSETEEISVDINIVPDDAVSLEQIKNIQIFSSAIYKGAQREFDLELLLTPPDEVIPTDKGVVEGDDERYPGARDNDLVFGNTLNKDIAQGDAPLVERSGTSVVTFKDVPGQDWSIQPNTETTIEADEVYFTDPLEIMHKTGDPTILNIKASLIAFYEDIEFKRQGGSTIEYGNLCLQLPEEEDALYESTATMPSEELGSGKPYGIVYFGKVNNEGEIEGVYFQDEDGESHNYKGFYYWTDPTVCLQQEHEKLKPLDLFTDFSIENWDTLWK